LKYSIECKVTSNIYLEHEASFQLGNKYFAFSTNANRIIDRIKIIEEVKNPEQFYSKISSQTSSIKVQINDDPTVREDIITYFQYLEGQLGFSSQLTKIFWNEPFIEWIPETEEEKNNLHVFSSHFERVTTFPPTHFPVNILKSIVEEKTNLDSYTLLTSFYREGKVFFDRLEFINAFYDFYFILEDLFGNNNWRNQLVKKSFMSSRELQESINWVIANLIDSSKKHKDEIIRLLSQKGLEYSINGIVELLVEMRGNLHHFSSKSVRKQKPSPLAHQDYESLVYLAMSIANQSLIKKLGKVSKLYFLK